MGTQQQRQRRRGFKTVGKRQQQRHCDDTAETGKDADHQTIDDADDHEKDGLRRQQRGKTCGDGFNHAVPLALCRAT